MRKAMILAAGKGTRMLPLTQHKPKALLELHGKPLIQYHIEALAQAGFTDIIINLHYCGNQIKQALGHGKAYGVNIKYSEETDLLETGGGIYQALPLLGSQPFILLNCDMWTDYPLATLHDISCTCAHLILATNPPHLPGNFNLDSNRYVMSNAHPALTYTGIAVIHPSLITHPIPRHPKFSYMPRIRKAIQQRQVTGEHYTGTWLEIGTPERLKQAHNALTHLSSNTMHTHRN